MHPTKRRLNHLDMLLKLRRIKAYYNSITVDDLCFHQKPTGANSDSSFTTDDKTRASPED